MKYIAILDSENEFTEEVINDLKNTGFLGDNPRYAFVIDDIQERKVGKWIYHEKSISTAFKDLRECSCCHCYFRWEMPRNSYCPNCGADMRGAENE